MSFYILAIIAVLLASAVGIGIIVAFVGLNRRKMPKLPRERWKLIKALARGGPRTTGALHALQRAQTELAAHAGGRR